MRSLGTLVVLVISLSAMSTVEAAPKLAKHSVLSPAEAKAAAVKRYKKYFRHSRKALRAGAIPTYGKIAQLRASVGLGISIGARLGLLTIHSKGMVQHNLLGSLEGGAGKGLELAGYGGVGINRLHDAKEGDSFPVLERVSRASGAFVLGASREYSKSKKTQLGKAQYLGVGVGVSAMPIYRLNSTVALHKPTMSPLLRLLNKGAKLSESASAKLAAGDAPGSASDIAQMAKVRSKVQLLKEKRPDLDHLEKISRPD